MDAIRTSSPTGLTRAARITVRVLLAELLFLVATGVALFFGYRPTVAQAWDDVTLRGAGVGAIGVVRSAHRLVSVITVWTALAAAVITFVEPASRWRWRRSSPLAIGILVAVTAAAGTGYVLPWDQLALWAVSVGSEMKGYLPLFDDKVRFLLIDGKEMSKSTLLRWVVIHVVFALAAVVLVGAAVRRLRPATAVPKGVGERASDEGREPAV